MGDTDSFPQADWSLIPQHMRSGLARYIHQGVPPGSFLSAVLSNDLREACGRADDVNRHAVFDYVVFLHQYAPAPCWGSPAQFSAWIKRGGMVGKAEPA